MKFENPIISGFYPDPSICRVKDDFYLVTSTFEYFPGIPIFRSQDLTNWTQIGHCIDRKDQLVLTNKAPNALGLYAPTIRYIDGRFYVICTNVGSDQISGSGNFFVWTDDPENGWSDPVWLDTPGIDPSLFTEDGQTYYVGTDGGIYLCTINLQTGEVGPKTYIWKGTGAADPEGPHLYKKNGWYYLLISEGGTGYGHMISMARSRSISGPYQVCPSNPVLTNRSMSSPIQAAGHADLVQDTVGNWWAVCLGIRPLDHFPKKHLLGRETFLVPVNWEHDWPVFGNQGTVDLRMDGPLPQSQVSKERVPHDTRDYFTENFAQYWNFLYEYKPESLFLSENGLHLLGTDGTLDSEEAVCWIGRRQQHFSFSAKAMFNFSDLNEKEEFGITMYLNRSHHYELLIKQINGIRTLVFRQIVGPFTKEIELGEIKDSHIILSIRGTKENYTFSIVSEKDEQQFIQADTKYLTTEVGGVFTGVYIGMYASGDGHTMKKPVVCHWFDYKEIKED